MPDRDDPALTSDELFIASHDGTDQRYVLVLPRAFDESRPQDVIIALHGHGSDRWQFVRDPCDECRAVRDVAAERGLVLVSPDYRAGTSWMGPAAEADTVQIIGIVRERFRARRVFVCGASMGGAACLTFAVLHPDLVDGVTSMNGLADFLSYDEFQDAISDSFGGTKAEVPVEYRRRSAVYHAERLTMPVALVVSGRDALVPPGSVRLLARKLGELGRPTLLIDRPDTGHVTSYEDARMALEWMAERAGD